MSAVRQLFEHYRAYHSGGPPRLKYMGYVAALGLILLYFVRFTRPHPDLFDDMVLRLPALALFALAAVPERWPPRWQRYYLPFTYAVQLLCLPFATLLVALQRGGGVPAVSNLFIMLFFLVLLTDWRNTLAMLFAGCSVAAGVYALTSAGPHIPRDLVAQLPAYAFIVIGGSLFKVSTAQLDIQRKLLATRALAGSIAHEMRSPLAQLSQHLQAMLAALPPPCTSTGVQALDARDADALYSHLAQGEVAIQRGLQVISMTLDEVGARPPAPLGTDFLWAAQTVRHAVSEHAYESEEDRHRVAVLVLEDFRFRGEETSCLFVLFNLLSNALAAVAGQAHGGITITIARHQIRVRDTGPGIAPFRMASLFKPFQTAGKVGGTGLGLAYCQRAMLAFGGSIQCESAEGEFAEFILQFPRMAAPPEKAGADGADDARAALARLRVLVVDDEPLQRRALRTLLQLPDRQVDDAEGGEAALALMACRRYDLVILDLHMNGIDGYEVAMRVGRGAVPLNRNVCLVAHSAEATPVTRLKARKAGMHGFVAKSMEQLPLQRVLADALALCAKTPPRAAPGGCRVLLADDSAPGRQALAATLAQAGVQVVQARHGGEVLAHLQANGAGPARFDAVLLDLHMPVLDGLETARAIRRFAPAARDVSLVAVTASDDAASREAARAAGIDAFITKPVDLPALLRVLGRSARSDPPPIADITDTAQLLDLPRLQTYTRMNRLDELLDDYLPEILRLAEKLPACARLGDRAECLEVLHSLLGMSGEAGALALYQAARKVYRPLLEEETWPPQRLWAEDLLRLARRCNHALRAHARHPQPLQTLN